MDTVQVCGILGVDVPTDDVWRTIPFSIHKCIRIVSLTYAQTTTFLQHWMDEIATCRSITSSAAEADSRSEQESGR